MKPSNVHVFTIGHFFEAGDLYGSFLQYRHLINHKFPSTDNKWAHLRGAESSGQWVHFPDSNLNSIIPQYGRQRAV